MAKVNWPATAFGLFRLFFFLLTTCRSSWGRWREISRREITIGSGAHSGQPSERFPVLIILTQYREKWREREKKDRKCLIIFFYIRCLDLFPNGSISWLLHAERIKGMGIGCLLVSRQRRWAEQRRCAKRPISLRVADTVHFVLRWNKRRSSRRRRRGYKPTRNSRSIRWRRRIPIDRSMTSHNKQRDWSFIESASL